MDEPIRVRAPSDAPPPALSTTAAEALAGYLDELERICEAATPGPWTRDEHGDGLIAPGHHPVAEAWGGASRFDNARFIEAARHALPKLIAKVRELRAELELVHQRVQFETNKDDSERRSLQRELSKLYGSDPSFGCEPGNECGRVGCPECQK
jgi:hypothetical protein